MIESAGVWGGELDVGHLYVSRLQFVWMTVWTASHGSHGEGGAGGGVLVEL